MLQIQNKAVISPGKKEKKGQLFVPAPTCRESMWPASAMGTLGGRVYPNPLGSHSGLYFS